MVTHIVTCKSYRPVRRIRTLQLEKAFDESYFDCIPSFPFQFTDIHSRFQFKHSNDIS